MSTIRPRSVVVLSALAVVLATPAAAQSGGWARMLTPQLEKYHQPEVNAVHFFNRHIGWAVGGHARDRTGKDQETFVFRTGDGGASWDRLTFYDGQEHVPDFVDIGFADARNGWLLSAGSLVLRTRDGGESWEPVEPLPRGWGRTLLVLGPDAAMVGSTSTNGRQINITTDGGRSWRNATVSPGGRDHVADLAFVAPGSFFAVVASAMQNAGGIYRSDDGGRSWSPVAEGKDPLHTIAFSESGRNGVAAGAGASYWTRDGGASWQRVAASGARYAARFVDESRVVAFGSGPSLLVSDDGGRTWRPGPGPDAGSAVLVDIQMVDPGWWLVSGGRGAHDLFRYQDPGYSGTVASATVTLPGPIRSHDGTALPPGRYDFGLRHTGLDHGFWLSLREPAEGVETGVEPGAGGGEEGALGPDQYGCDPCEGAFPVDVTYEAEDLPPGQSEGPPLQLSIEPSASGIVLVLDVAATPPRDLGRALAALGVSREADLDARDVARAAAAKKEEGGGLFGRLKKAAAGDIRGAVEGAVDPVAATERYEADNAGPPATYRLKLRYPLNLFGSDGP